MNFRESVFASFFFQQFQITNCAWIVILLILSFSVKFLCINNPAGELKGLFPRPEWSQRKTLNLLPWRILLDTKTWNKTWKRTKQLIFERVEACFKGRKHFIHATNLFHCCVILMKSLFSFLKLVLDTLWALPWQYKNHFKILFRDYIKIVVNVRN